LDGALPRTAPARFRFANTARFLAHREVTSVIHGFRKSSFRASGGQGDWSNGVVE
jgi:hypothetical protein